jgi:NADH pyrophosphatase NudC (nudix superfamily)
MKGSTEGELLLRCADAVRDCQKGHKQHWCGASGGLLEMLLEQLKRYCHARKNRHLPDP